MGALLGLADGLAVTDLPLGLSDGLAAMGVAVVGCFFVGDLVLTTGFFVGTVFIDVYIEE